MHDAPSDGVSYSSTGIGANGLELNDDDTELGRNFRMVSQQVCEAGLLLACLGDSDVCQLSLRGCGEPSPGRIKPSFDARLWLATSEQARHIVPHHLEPIGDRGSHRRVARAP